ncbi:MAG: hypothetical protein HQ573_02195 [Desulfobacteraceae bacterium]|nr:hypothetical protein [Desulfobacteraceae bacterium]
MDTPKKMGSFSAQGSDGKKYNINIWADLVESFSSSGSHITPGQMTFKTDDRNIINYKKKGIYELHTAFGPIELTSDDPQAP